MKQDLYSVKELVDTIIEDYHLPIQGEGAISNYRQKISRTLHDTGIWDKGVPKTVGKKTTMYFTYQQKQELISEKALYDYLRDRSQSTEIHNSKRFDEIKNAIEERRIAHIEYLRSRKTGDYDDNIPVITDKEFREYKKDMMITALFEKFFTPIDDKLLYSDLYRVEIIENELNLQIEDIEAENRLSHPNLYYYKERK